MRELVNEHGADVNAKDNSNNDALILSVLGNHKYLVRVLIKEFHFNVNTSLGLNGITPLLQACVSGHTDLARELVNEHGADVNSKDNRQHWFEIHVPTDMALPSIVVMVTVTFLSIVPSITRTHTCTLSVSLTTYLSFSIVIPTSGLLEEEEGNFFQCFVLYSYV